MNTTYKEIKHIGYIPAEWEVSHLDKITKKKIVYGIVQAGPPQEEGIPYIRSTDVGGTINTSALLRTTEIIAKQYSRSEVVPGDIVFSLRGNVGETSIVPRDLKVANLTQGTARISVKDKFSNQYIRYALSSVAISRHINAVAKGSTFREITLEDLRKINIPLPPSEEQKRIAAMLEMWDRSIDLTEHLIASKQERQRWLMQQLLTGKKRLPGFDKTWQTVHLGDVFANRVETNRTDLPLVAITGSGGVVSRHELNRRDTSSEDKSKYLRICPGDIGYNTMRMWQGVCGFSQLEGIVSPAYTIVTPKNRVDGEFMALLFKSLPTIHLFHRHSQGLVDDTLNLKWHHFSEIKVTVPDKPEQQAIAAVFRIAARELDLLRSQLSALQEQKKGLMQQLLTGKVRVKV
jgi:type I restriction enzyme S subunit